MIATQTVHASPAPKSHTRWSLDRRAEPVAVRTALAEHLPSLRAHALRLTRSDADSDDLVQETILRALRFEGTFERGTNLRGWLHQILQSVFFSRCRSSKRERRALERFRVDPNLFEANTNAIVGSVTPRMETALRSLPPKYLDVLVLVDLREHSYKEAAGELEVPVGTIMSRLFRARRLLQSALFAPELPTAA